MCGLLLWCPIMPGGAAYCNDGGARYGECSGIFWRNDSEHELGESPPGGMAAPVKKLISELKKNSNVTNG